jgi:hypothetical protein
MKIKNLISHLKTVHIHRKYVRQLCFKMGLYKQGLLHDLSKYSPIELSIAKYYSGTNSPHQNCREVLGYSPSWMHHYHTNKHHYQYWQDQDEMDRNIPLKMPYNYVVEMFCDRVAACKAYNKEKYTLQDALNYYNAKTKGHGVLHIETEWLLEKLLKMLAGANTEEDFIKWYKGAWHSLVWLYDRGIMWDILTPIEPAAEENQESRE